MLQAALAAEAAELRPRALMMAAPRCWMTGMKVSLNQASSAITWLAGWPLIFVLAKSGYIVELWLPQMARLVMAVVSTPALRASWALARFSSSLVIAKKRLCGTPAAAVAAMRALVLQGLPTTSTRTSLAALAAMALP